MLEEHNKIKSNKRRKFLNLLKRLLRKATDYDKKSSLELRRLQKRFEPCILYPSIGFGNNGETSLY